MIKRKFYPGIACLLIGAFALIPFINSGWNSATSATTIFGILFLVFGGANMINPDEGFGYW